MLPYINIPFAYAASALGASVDEIKLIALMLMSYPLAGLLKRIPDRSPHQKNIFIIFVSTFYLVGLFDLWAGVRTLLVSSAGAYAISYFIHGPFMPWIGFVFLMGHMSVNHIHRKVVNDPSAVDITGAQMVLVMKLTAFCWNVHDGRLLEEDLSDQQKENAVRIMPGFLDYAAFVLFFPSLMAGPAFDYIEYRRWIETTMFQLPPGVDASKAPPTRKKRKIPRSGTPATIKAAGGLLWILAFIKLSGYYSASALTSPSYTQYNILRRIWILHAVGFTARTKYYGVWALAEGACILSGIGYKGISPVTGRADWSRLQNVKPLGIELAQNSRAYLGNWNMNTNNWLRNYMYLRVTPKGKKPGFRASLATFVTSAFWHGFEPGYYMAFVLAAFIQTVAKNSRRLLRPFFMTPDGAHPTPSKRYYDVFSWLCTQLAFSFTVAPFILLSGPASLSAWASVYFYAVLGVAGALAFFASPGKAFLKARLNKRNKSSKAAQADRLGRSTSRESFANSTYEGSGGTLGLPDDPERDFDEMMDEVRREVQSRRERGLSISQALKEKSGMVG